MRAILYWYARGLGKAMWYMLIPFAVLFAGITSELLMVSGELMQAATAWADTYLYWLAGGVTFLGAVGVGSWIAQGYLTKPSNAPLPPYYEKNAILAIVPIILPVLGFALLADATSTHGNYMWVIVTGLVAFGSLGVGILLGLWFKRAFRSDWQAEHFDELKEETAEVLRVQGAFMPHDIETAFKGRTYAEVAALKGQCLIIGDLTERQTDAYNALMNTMNGYGVNVSTGAAFANKTAAELLAEEKERNRE